MKKLRSFGALTASSTAVLCSALLVFPMQVAAAPRAAAAPTGFVTASGTQLTVQGKPYKFAGYNLPCANPETLVQSGNLDFYLNDIQQNSAANLVRVWFFQSEGGPGNWTDFDTVISD